MFWGLVLEPSKKYTQKVDQTFHISQAALDLKSCDANEPIQLVVEYENSSFVLATLSKKANIFQVPLDLIFKTGDQVSFRTIGNGKVHLSGYHVLEDLDSMIMNGEEESDLDEEIEMEKGKGKRKKLTPNSKGSKKAKLDNTNETGTNDDEFDEEDSENEMDKALGKKTKKKNQKSDSSLASMDDDEDEDEDEDELDEEDFDDEDDDIEMDEEEDDEELEFSDTDDEEAEEENEVKPKSPKSEGKKSSPQTPNGVAGSIKGKEKPSQKGNNNVQQGTPGKEKKTPKSETKQKGDKKGKPVSAESTPQRKNEEKTQKSPKAEGSPQKKVLEGGVISEELRVGNGPVAKPGKMANVYYVGTLASTKKQFDSVQSGSGFKFRVGRNEVIKGWDIGVIGMKVGGKRRLTIPPHLAYGSKGSPPVIPPNSTLVFTVELKGIS